jgi:hypothetical protein
VFNWATMAYSLQVSYLTEDRTRAACALLKGTKGEKMVAIAGGNSDGIEVWNLANGSVTTLNSTFPLSAPHPNMIAVNGNTELIFYESFYGVGSPKGIWIFSEVTNTWTKLGEMMNRRASFSALPVDGFTCP